MALCYDDMVFLKSIDVKLSVFKYIEDLKTYDSMTYMNDNRLMCFKEDYQAHFIKENAVYIYQLNDKQDVAVQISNKKEDEVKQVVNKCFNYHDRKLMEKLLVLEKDISMKFRILAQ